MPKAAYLAGLLIAVSLTGCTYVPFQKHSVARAKPDAVAEANRVQTVPTTSAVRRTEVRPLQNGHSALYNRLRMIDQAKRTLDVSAFIIRQDHSGHLFIDRLVKAADRGVKVRLLLDDLFNRHTAGKFVALDHHPNIEVRIFNPFSRYSLSGIGFLLDFDRVRRRMHSRMMVVDHDHVILGGRNIADEYYSDDGTSAFSDFEVLARGEVAENFVATFDAFWGDRWTLPATRLEPMDFSTRYTRLRRELPDRAKQAAREKYPDLVTETLKLRKQAALPTFVADAHMVTDLPQKLRESSSPVETPVAAQHFQMVNAAKKSVLIVTPYFIPEDWGAQTLQNLAERGIKVTIVTNSLASTNHVATHGGYTNYRDRLIKSGVAIHELHHDPAADGAIRNVLHAKFTIVDGEHTIVTTMNFDPVSIKGNCETSLVVHGAEFAKWMLQQVNPAALDQTYHVAVDEDGELHWYAPSGNGVRASYREPGASPLRRVISDLSLLLNLEGML